MQAQMNRDQLRHIVRAIVMHDTGPAQDVKCNPREACRQVMSTLQLNFNGAYDHKMAERLVLDMVNDV